MTERKQPDNQVTPKGAGANVFLKINLDGPEALAAPTIKPR